MGVGWHGAVSALALLVGLATPARAQQELPPLVSYCAPGGPEARAARDAVRALQGAIEDPGVSLEALAARYAALREGPCFAPASHFAPSFGSRAALRVWWDEGGGEWLHHFARGHAPGSALEIVIPPEARPALSLEASPRDHRLRSLLCSETDEACGRETAGWTLRAQAAFDAHAARERERARHAALRVAEEGDAEAATRATETSRFARCGELAREAPTLERFPRWRECISEMRDSVSALPVGRVQAPARGWLVLRGRRGHYQFCDEIRAYDLATGAAYVASSCGGLVLGSGGSVQGDATDAGRTSGASAGGLPVDALREAAWMLLLGPEVDRHHQPMRRVLLPIDVPSQYRSDVVGVMGRSSGWASSDQTRLRWAWVDGRRILAAGMLTWPSSDAAAEDHAASLVRVVEAALAPGCAPAALPRGLALGPASDGVSPIDADAASLRRAAEALETSLRGVRAPRCQPRPSNRRHGDFAPRTARRAVR